MWVVDSAVALAVELGCMSRQTQVVSVLVAETAVALVADSAAVLVADSAVALAVELDCMSRQAQVVSVLVAVSAADSVRTSRLLQAASQ